jgi:hypothetical protein
MASLAELKQAADLLVRPDLVSSSFVVSLRLRSGRTVLMETLNKSFDRLRTNGKWLISFVVSLSNHTANLLVQCFLMPNSCRSNRVPRPNK